MFTRLRILTLTYSAITFVVMLLAWRGVVSWWVYVVMLSLLHLWIFSRLAIWIYRRHKSGKGEMGGESAERIESAGQTSDGNLKIAQTPNIDEDE